MEDKKLNAIWCVGQAINCWALDIQAEYPEKEELIRGMFNFTDCLEEVIFDKPYTSELIEIIDKYTLKKEKEQQEC